MVPAGGLVFFILLLAIYFKGLAVAILFPAGCILFLLLEGRTMARGVLE